MGQAQSQKAQTEPEPSNTGSSQDKPGTPPGDPQLSSPTSSEPASFTTSPLSPPPRLEPEREAIASAQASQSAEPPVVDTEPQDPELFDEEEELPYFSDPPQQPIGQNRSSFINRTPRLDP